MDCIAMYVFSHSLHRQWFMIHLNHWKFMQCIAIYAHAMTLNHWSHWDFMQCIAIYVFSHSLHRQWFMIHLRFMQCIAIYAHAHCSTFLFSGTDFDLKSLGCNAMHCNVCAQPPSSDSGSLECAVSKPPDFPTEAKYQWYFIQISHNYKAYKYHTNNAGYDHA